MSTQYNPLFDPDGSLNRPLPCIACGFQPEPVERDQDSLHQPYEATMFSAGAGHYGSTVWDSTIYGQSLEINVCDKCLVAHKDRVAVVLTVRRPETHWRAWEPGED